MKFKKDDEGRLVLDEHGDPIAISEQGEVIPLDKVVSLGKHARVETERDEFKAEVGRLRDQIAELSKVTGDKDALEKRLAEITAGAEKTKADLESLLAARDKEYALDTALLGAGVPSDRLKAARALIDTEKLAVADGGLTGFDAESFKKDAPYLFAPAPKVDSAAASRGVTGAVSIEEAEKMSVGEYAKARADGRI